MSFFRTEAKQVVHERWGVLAAALMLIIGTSGVAMYYEDLGLSEFEATGIMTLIAVAAAKVGMDSVTYFDRNTN